MLAHAAGWAHTHGHLAVPLTHLTPDGSKLGTWLATQRSRHNTATLRPDRDAHLRRLDPGWATAVVRDHFSDGVAACDRYLAAHGHLRAPLAYVDPQGHHLGSWLAHQRDRAEGKRRPPLTDAQRHALDARGMDWTRRTVRDLTATETAELRAARDRGRNHPEVGRTLLRLHAAGVGQRQLADALGVQPGTVSSRIRTATRHVNQAR